MINMNIHNQLKIYIVLFICAAGFSAEKNVRLKSMTSKVTATDPLGVKARFLSATKLVGSEPETINVLALRAQFVPDSLKTTTGNGLFDLSNQGEYKIDHPPHNKEYFEHQLLALHNYFDFVSKGKLSIHYQVFPPASEAAYDLPHDMVYYSGQEDEELQKQAWAELLRDAVEAAKADNPGFEKFDAFIVFHAGVGNDFAFDFTETPFDIQSAFIDFETLKATLGQDNPNYEGIDAGNGFYIQEGIILPEQQSQKGIELGLLGTATLLMGSQIGMPSLFNTQTGRAGIGMWGLMDQGSYNYFGLIPAQPCAWMKLYMGWEEAVTANTLENALLGTSHTTTAPHLIKVPITSTEYFLLENRQEDWNGDRLTFGRDEFGKRAQFDSLGNIVVEEGLRVITKVDEYDYGMPGSGILIWHIDENVIRDNLESNTINDNPEHRGVDLVECDGPQDIGQQYAMFTPGYGTEAGDYWDPFWSGNISHKYINGERPVSLTPTSIPTSNAFGRAVTHIKFSDFSDKDTLMTFSVGNEKHMPGFPQYTGRRFKNGAISWIHMNHGQEKGIIAVAADGSIFGWKKDGSKIIDNDETVSVTNASGTRTVYPLALMAQVGDSVDVAPLTALDWNGDYYDDIAVADRNGIVTVWSPLDANNDGRADLLKRFDLGEALSSDLTIHGVGSRTGHMYWLESDGNEMIFRKHKVTDTAIHAVHEWPDHLWKDHFRRNPIILSSSNTIYAIAPGGDVLWQAMAYGNELYPVSVTGAEGQFPLNVVSRDGYITLIDRNGAVLNSATRIGDEMVVSPPALGDVDLDGVPELLVNGESFFYAFEIMNAVPVLNYPIPLQNPSSGRNSFAAPVWTLTADIEQSSRPIIATTSGFIQSYDESGAPVDGYPLKTGGSIAATPALVQFSAASDDAALIVVSNDGFVYAWSMEKNGKSSWDRYGGSPQNDFRNVMTAPVVPPSSDLMPKNRVFCYPNPSEDDRTIIRYTLNDNVEHMNIRIYDIAGELVTQFVDGGTAPGDHEVTWDLSAIQSGAYIARVEAQSNSGNVVEFIKIAVVK